MTEENQNEKSDMRFMAEAMNNLASALRDSNQLARDMQMISPKGDGVGLLHAVNELASRIAVLSTRLR